MSEKPICPDISDILQRKAEARRKWASLSFAEKIAKVEALNKRLAPLNNARQKQIGANVLARLAADAKARADGIND